MGDMLEESPHMDSLLNVRLSLVWRRFQVLTGVTTRLFNCTETFAAFHRLPPLEKLMQAHFRRRCLDDKILANAFFEGEERAAHGGLQEHPDEVRGTLEAGSPHAHGRYLKRKQRVSSRSARHPRLSTLRNRQMHNLVFMDFLEILFCTSLRFFTISIVRRFAQISTTFRF